MARQGGFLSGPSVHGTSKLQKHVLKRGVTRDMNAAAGAFVNTKSPLSSAAGFYGAAPKAIGPRFGKTINPKRARFGTRGAGRILGRRR
jgi:hypothetical protein|tara:strand:+ start:203 stop:469 length:267 start_codon:yes stop_codon:yes gene_type:complete